MIRSTYIAQTAMAIALADHGHSEGEDPAAMRAAIAAVLLDCGGSAEALRGCAVAVAARIESESALGDAITAELLAARATAREAEAERLSAITFDAAH